MDWVGCRVKVKFLRQVVEDSDSTSGYKSIWMRGTVLSFRPSTGKHLVAFDVVYGRCVRGKVFWQLLGQEEQPSGEDKAKEEYKQTFVDRKAVLIVPCKYLEGGVICQRWERTLYFDRCRCNRQCLVSGFRKEEKGKIELEDPNDPVTQCMNWAAWLDLKYLMSVQQAGRTEQLPMVCVCRKVMLPPKNGGYAGEIYVQCSKCREYYHNDCITGCGAEGGDENTWECPFCEALALKENVRSGRRGKNDSNNESDLPSRKRKLEEIDENEQREQTNSSKDKDTSGFDNVEATAHRKLALPACLSTCCAWKFWYVAKRDSELEDEQQVPGTGQGEWVYCLNTLQHMCGSSGNAFVDAELDARNGTFEQHREDVLQLYCLESEVEEKRRSELIGNYDVFQDGDENHPCGLGAIASIVNKRDGYWGAEVNMETFMRNYFKSEYDDSPLPNSTQDSEKSGGESVPVTSSSSSSSSSSWFTITPNDRLIVHSPHGGKMQVRTGMYEESEFAASVMATDPTNKENPGYIANDGTRFIMKWPGSFNTTGITCARIRARSEADFKIASKQDRPPKPKPSSSRTTMGGSSAGSTGGLSSLVIYSDAQQRKEDLLSKVTTRKRGKSKGNAAIGQRRHLRDVAESFDDITAKHLSLGREKRLRFGKSGIHAWGVYAEEPLAANDFVIEYKGELIRPIIGDLREKFYEEQGIPDYMFRIDDETICDATKKGSLARFINHSCEPNCFTSIISHQGVKKIVIYAKRAITTGEELSYDYKFPIETDPAEKILCFCGAPTCRKFMN